MMVERDEHEREQRIKRMTEKSLQMSKLPPRMQAAEEARKEKDQGSQASEQLFDFRPPRPRSVPDFTRLQKEFITKMENSKKAKGSTIIQPFRFSQARPSANLRTYMDQQNQVINPTLTKGKRSHSAQRDQIAEQPSSTAKHNAIVESNRRKMEIRLAEEKSKQDEELQRRIIQTRLQQRVALSPALQNNTKSLAKKREQFQIQKG